MNVFVIFGFGERKGDKIWKIEVLEIDRCGKGVDKGKGCGHWGRVWQDDYTASAWSRLSGDTGGSARVPVE